MELGQERQVNVGHKERAQASAEVVLSCKRVITNEDALSVLFVRALVGRVSQSVVRKFGQVQKNKSFVFWCRPQLSLWFWFST